MNGETDIEEILHIIKEIKSTDKDHLIIIFA